MGRVMNVLEQMPKFMSQIKPGDIIVVEGIRAVHSDYMKKAVGYITNTGGQTSSTGILARSWEKPAVVGTMGQGETPTEVLKTGQWVVVDGTEGTVYECLEIKKTNPG
jgi:phosphoenolpyruvate synthase/pyruvate phosphate dikinase